jgi:phenylacetate-CoA ligase
MQRLAEFVRQKGWDDIKFKGMLSSAEVLYPHQRQFIEETFGGKIFDRYGTRELGGLGCQCQEHTGLHVSVENVYLEVLDERGEPARAGEPGQVVVTNLNNYGMPFIRYTLADVASWVPAYDCPCGRAHPMLSVVEGRHNDMFRTRDGRMVWGGIANPLWGMSGVTQFQFIQKTYDLVHVRIVTKRSLQPDELARVERAVQTALGSQVRVDFEFPEAIPTDKSGKYRYQICEVSREEVVL